MVNFHVAKPEMLALSKMGISAFLFSKGAHMTTAQYNSGCLKWLPSKLPRKLQSALLLILEA